MTIPGRLLMERDSLDDVPCFPVPTGYAILPYRPGDEKHWLDIHLDADRLSPITPALFEEQFGSDVEELGARQFYLHHGAEVVGTCSAWYDRTYKDGTWGRVHWLAIKTSYQGKGLSRPLLSGVLIALRQLGHTRAYLTTLRQRPRAIRLYESFGFLAVS